MDIERFERSELAYKVLVFLEDPSRVIDHKGHVTVPVRFWYLLTILHDLPPEQLRGLHDAIVSGQPLKNPVVLAGNISNRCNVCAEELSYLVDGTTISAEKPCPYPNGISLQFELDISSGIMVVANFLWPSFGDVSDLLEENPHGQSINMAAGRAWQTKTLAERGCACAIVYNSCPSIYRVNENELLIANPGYDSDTDEEFPPEGEYVCQITTDWYWYAIADKNNLKQRGDDVYGQTDEISVKPGIYTFDHFVDVKGFHEKPDTEPEVYTRITWTRPSPKKTKKKNEDPA